MWYWYYNWTFNVNISRKVHISLKQLCRVVMYCCSTGCFSKDQVYLDGILRILRHRRNIDFKMLTSLGKVNSLYLNSVNHLYVDIHITNTHTHKILACRCPMKMWNGYVILRSCGEPGFLTSCKTKNVTCGSWTTSSWLTNWTILSYKSSFHEDEGLVIHELFFCTQVKFGHLVIPSCDSVQKKTDYLF